MPNHERQTKQWGPSKGYVYQPLAANEGILRVLRLLPGSGSQHLQCYLMHVCLADQPPPDYETISYCWGNAMRRVNIEIDGVFTKVPANTAAALKKLRYVDKERVVWIDAVCIDQKNIEERNNQVAIMGRIYKCGRNNLIWLGNDKSTNAPSMVRYVNRLVEHMRAETEDFKNAEKALFDPSGAFRFPKQGFPAGFEHCLGSIKALVHLPWFRRIWVVQEAALSRQSICYWGNCTFNLLDVLRSVLWLNYKGGFRERVAIDRHLHFIVGISMVSDRKIWSMRRREDTEFRFLLAAFRQTEAADPRDKIYGLLGLYKERRGLTHLPTLLRPDYSQRPADVYRKATLHMVQETQDLDFLGFINHGEDQDDVSFPSWVPRWDRIYRWHTGASPLSFHFDAACGRLCQLHSLPQDIGHICLSGLRLDTLQDSSDVMSQEDFASPMKTRRLLATARRMMCALPKLTDAEIEMDNTLATTLIAGIAHGGKPADHHTVTNFQALEKLIDELETLPFPSWLSRVDPPTNEGENLLLWAYLKVMLRRCDERRLFTTQAAMAGLGPRTMRNGDFVVILYGGKWPFVLRPQDDKYRFVGQCYVHGIMHGEAVERYRAEGPPDFVFELV